MRKYGKELTSLPRYRTWEPQSGSQKAFLYLLSELRYFHSKGETPTTLLYIFIYVKGHRKVLRHSPSSSLTILPQDKD